MRHSPCPQWLVQSPWQEWGSAMAWMRFFSCFFDRMREKLPTSFIRYKVAKIQIQASGMEPVRDAVGKTWGTPRSPSQTDTTFPSWPFFSVDFWQDDDSGSSTNQWGWHQEGTCWLLTEDLFLKTEEEVGAYWVFWFRDNGGFQGPGPFFSASSWAKGLGYPGRALGQQCWEAV